MSGGFSAQVKEVINRNLLVTALLEHDQNAYLPVYDRGVDLIAYDNKDRSVRPIQLKGRWMIMTKYSGKGIWVAFPEADEWFLALHDEMVSMGEEMGYCSTSSWLDRFAYSVQPMSKKLRALMTPWILGSSISQALEAN